MNRGLVAAVVLVGAPGAGKTSVLEALSSVLEGELVEHGVIEAEQFSLGWPLLPASVWVPQLDATLSLQRQAGRSRFLISATVETAEDLAAIRKATAADQMVVVCLCTSPDTVAVRLDAREPDGWPGKAALIERARRMASVVHALAGVDLVVGTEGKQPHEAAREVMQALRDRGMLE